MVNSMEFVADAALPESMRLPSPSAGPHEDLAAAKLQARTRGVLVRQRADRRSRVLKQWQHAISLVQLDRPVRQLQADAGIREKAREQVITVDVKGRALKQRSRARLIRLSVASVLTLCSTRS